MTIAIQSLEKIKLVDNLLVKSYYAQSIKILYQIWCTLKMKTQFSVEHLNLASIFNVKM